MEGLIEAGDTMNGFGNFIRNAGKNVDGGEFITHLDLMKPKVQIEGGTVTINTRKDPLQPADSNEDSNTTESE